MSPISESARKNGFVFYYFVLVLIIGGAAYAPWVLSSYKLFPSDLATVFLLLGGLSPAIVAVVLTAGLSGKSGLRSLFGGFTRRGFRKTWFLAAFLAPLVLCLISLGLWFLLQPNAVGVYGFDLVSLAVFPVLLLTSFLLNMWKEVGWRGFAQKRLQTRFSVLLSSFIVGFFWAIWNWPLLIVSNSALLNSYQNPLLFGAFTLLISVVYAWVYNSTRGSLLAVSLFSASINAFTPLLFFNSAIAYSVFPYYFGVCAAFSLGLIFWFRSSFWVPKPDLN